MSILGVMKTLALKEKNGVILTYKVESLAGIKFDPGLRFIREYLSQIDSQYRVKLTLNTESNWLSIPSQFDSNILQLLRILVPPVTQLFRSKWLHFFFQCILLFFVLVTQYVFCVSIYTGCNRNTGTKLNHAPIQTKNKTFYKNDKERLTT